jgi:hypothetical protein
MRFIIFAVILSLVFARSDPVGLFDGAVVDLFSLCWETATETTSIALEYLHEFLTETKDGKVIFKEIEQTIYQFSQDLRIAKCKFRPETPECIDMIEFDSTNTTVINYVGYGLFLLHELDECEKHFSAGECWSYLDFDDVLAVENTNNIINFVPTFLKQLKMTIFPFPVFGTILKGFSKSIRLGFQL